MSQSRASSSHKEGYCLGKYKIDYDPSGPLYKVVSKIGQPIELEEVFRGTIIYREKNFLYQRSKLFTKDKSGKRLEVGYKSNLLRPHKDMKKIIKEPVFMSPIFHQETPVPTMSSPSTFSPSLSAISKTKKMVAFNDDEKTNIVIDTLDKASKMDQSKDYFKIHDLIAEAAVGKKLKSLAEPLTAEIVLSIKDSTGYDFLEAFQKTEDFFKPQQQLTYPTLSTPGTFYNPNGKRKELPAVPLFDSSLKKVSR